MDKRLFEIQTLSDCNDKRFPNLSQGGVDPVSIILGGLPVINQLFPNLFPNRRRLTEADWIKFFPSSGYWSSKLRNNLSSTIHYDTDLKNIPQFSLYFADRNAVELCGGTDCGAKQALEILMSNIRDETRTGGSGGGGGLPYPSGGNINWQQMILVGGGAILLLTLLNKKKK